MKDRWPGIVLCVALVVAIVSPRAAAAVSVILFVSLVVAGILLVRSGRLGEGYSYLRDGTIFAVLVFAGWGVLSSLWSFAPQDSLVKPAFLAVVAFLVPVGAVVVRALAPGVRQFLSEGAITAIGLGFAFMAVELVSGQAITRAVMTMIPALYSGEVERTETAGGVTTLFGKHFTVVDGVVSKLSATNINRRAALLVCLFWPGVLLILNERNLLRRWLCAAAVGVGTLAILVLGSHQSSQAAIFGSVVIFALAVWRARVAGLVVSGLWAAAVVLVVAAMSVAGRPSVYCSPQLFHSASHRVVIWGTMAQNVLERPLLGVGADATPEAARKLAALDPAPNAVCENGKFGSPYGKYSRHAHNVYLQVWFELGVVGAVLFLIAGLSILRRIGRYQKPLEPYALALFGSVAALMAFSYSLWQMWFLASIGLGAFVLMAAHLDTRRLE